MVGTSRALLCPPYKLTSNRHPSRSVFEGCAARLPPDRLQHLADIPAVADERLVFLDDHELDVAPDRNVGIGQIALQLAIGHATKPSELCIVIGVERSEAVLFDQDGGRQ